MNHYLIAFAGSLLMFALTVQSKQATTSSNEPTKHISNKEELALPSVETQLKILTEKLDLAGDQQKKVEPILRELHEATEKIGLDQKLSYVERLEKVRTHRYDADKRIRMLLTEDQKKKLDQYEAGPHGEMHGNLTGTPNSQQSPKKD